MLAIALRLFLLCELSFYAWIALDGFKLPPSPAALFAVGGVLLARANINLITWIYARAWQSPAPRLGPARAAAMMLGEYLAFLACFILILPFERLWMGEDRLRPGGARPPLLLIHGYGCSRGAWWWLRRRLEAAGWTVATINLEPVYTSIDNYAEPLSRRIDEVLAQTGAARLILVGHSMGGLVARAFMRRYGAARIARVVTLGTPYGGSRLALLGIGCNGRQMEAGSAWLQALAQEAPAVDTIAIVSPRDNYVMPQTNLELPGARMRRVDGIGHLAMLFSPRVAAALCAALEEPATASAD